MDDKLTGAAVRRFLVRCISPDEFDAGAQYADVILNAVTQDELRRRRAAFVQVLEQDAGVYCLHYWDSTPTFYCGADTDRLGSDHLDENELTCGSGYLEVPPGVNLCQAETDMDAATLVLTKEGFFWSALLPHTNTGVETEEIQWETLDEPPAPVTVLPGVDLSGRPEFWLRHKVEVFEDDNHVPLTDTNEVVPVRVTRKFQECVRAGYEPIVCHAPGSWEGQRWAIVHWVNDETADEPYLVIFWEEG